MTRNRATARAMWQALADANFTRDNLLWLANVAADILKADDAPDNLRPGRLLYAVQLSGAFDAERQIIRSVVHSVDRTCVLIERGSRWRPARPLRRGEQRAMRRAAVAEALGLQKSDEAIDKQIERVCPLPPRRKI